MFVFRVAKMLDKTSSIICAFGLAAAAPRSPYRHLELCGIALNFDYGLLAVYFCGLHRILFKINSPYGKAKFGSFLFSVLCASPSYLFSVNSCCCNCNFAFPFLCSLSSALLVKALALAAIVCRNSLNCCTLFIAGASPILLPLPSSAFLR